jgi:hypothetical protein
MQIPQAFPIYLKDKNGRLKAITYLDAKDADRFGHLAWYLTGTGYAAREQQRDRQRTRIYLHRAILGLTYGDGFQADHINCDRLDNRRENLRVVTNAENKQNKRLYSNNKSGFRGVCWQKAAQKWEASYRIQGKQHYLGLFDDPAKAASVAALARAETMPFSRG